jgi:hypothetical protein
MLQQLKRLAQRVTGRANPHMTDDDSPGVRDSSVIEAFVSDPDNTFLVSFPRTGSHWLRMLMELYFEQPSLVRVFFYPEVEDYLTLHTHDLDLDVERRRVIYLYREPVATIYSQLQYHEEDLDNPDRIAHWSTLYGCHLEKWLTAESFTEQKTLVRYDRLKANTAAEFTKVCNHFSVDFDADRFDTIAEQVSKQRVNERTEHDSQVVNLRKSYEKKRTQFRKEHGTQVWNFVLDGRSNLASHFAAAPTR